MKRERSDRIAARAAVGGARDVAALTYRSDELIFFVSQTAAIFTQKHLTPKQYSDAVVIGTSQPLTYLFCLKCIYNRKKCRQVLYYLAVVLKEVYNDKETEQRMIKKLKSFMIIYSLCAFFNWASYGVLALIDVMRSDAIFLPIISAWPDVEDTSTAAFYTRIVLYIFCCFSFYRLSTIFFIVLILYVSLSHQYMNMHRYFEGLNYIFEDTQLSYKEREKQFEEALIKGIKSHSDTLWCAKESQKICHDISALIVFLATTLMPMLLNCQNFYELCTHMTKLLISVMIIGFFMWNAGDVTVEAQKLPEAIFSCGWYNCCRKRSARIRSLVVVAMMQAQKPVVFTAFGVVELSYDTFVTIIKTAYSMVSVFYR